MKRLVISGYSLIELMIALALGLILGTSMIQVMLTAKQNYRITHTIAGVMENGRFALELIGLDIRRAGYWGLYTQQTDGDVMLPVGGSLGAIVPTHYCESDDKSWARMIGRPLYGLNDNKSGYDCISRADYLRGDILVTRHVASEPTGIDGRSIASQRYYDEGIYLRGGMIEASLFLGRDKRSMLNKVSILPALDYPLKAHAYYVGLTNRRCRGERVPALFRKKLTATGKFRREELIAGIENIQFQYQIDGQYFDAAQTLNWSAVTAVRVWVLSRANCPEVGLVDDWVYRLPNQNFTPGQDSPTRQYRRKLYSSVFAIRNPL